MEFDLEKIVFKTHHLIIMICNLSSHLRLLVNFRFWLLFAINFTHIAKYTETAKLTQIAKKYHTQLIFFCPRVCLMLKEERYVDTVCCNLAGNNLTHFLRQPLIQLPSLMHGGKNNDASKNFLCYKASGSK